MDEKDNQPSDSELEQRLDSIKSRLAQADQHREGAPSEQQRAQSRRHQKAGIAQAFRLSSEFIAGVVVGGGIGYAIDAFFNTSPWGLIVFLLLGFAAAILNVLRASGSVAPSSFSLKAADELQAESTRNRAESEKER